MMLPLAVLATTLPFLSHGHAQDEVSPDANLEENQKPSLISTRVSSSPLPPLVTGIVPEENVSTNLGKDVVFYDNATFATICAYNDDSCASRCSWHHDACSRTWAAWSRTGLEKSMNSDAYTTQTQSFHEITQSLKVVDGYTYAMGPEITTESGTKTISFWHPQLEVVSTLIPQPPCKIPDFSCSQQPWCNTNACTVQGGTVELLFWPPTTIAQGLRGNKTTSAAAGPVTAIYKNTTLTSPSVYLEYKTAYALNGCSQTIGGSYPGAILALDPDDLFSIDARNDFFVVTTTIKDELHTTSFYQSQELNYDHLTGLPPGAAYQGMPICVASGCNIITPSLFHPQLVVPTQIREMDSAWATCDLDWRGSWDPPIALSGAASIAVPTSRTEPIFTEPASPKATINRPAKVTSSPVEFTAPPLPVSSEQEVSEKSSVAFVYSPVISSGEIEPTSTLRTSQSSTNADPASPSVSITTTVQVDARPKPQPGTKSNADYSADSNRPAEPIETAETRTTATEATQAGSAEQSTGLAVPDNTLVAGEDPVTSSVQSIVSEGHSAPSTNTGDNPASPPSHSPTNAYEVLSEALGTIADHSTKSFDISFSAISSQSTRSSSSSPSAYTPSLTYAPLPHAVLDFGSTTITAVHHSSNLIQLGDQTLSLQSSTAVVIDDHTLGVSSDAIVVNGTATATFSSSTPGTGAIESLPSIEASGSSQALPSVTTEPPADDGEGNVSSEDEGDDDISGAGRLPQVPTTLSCLFVVLLYVAFAR